MGEPGGSVAAVVLSDALTVANRAGLLRQALDERLPLPERVLACVELIPPGRVMSYKDVAEFISVRGARHVGRVLAADGGTVNWHRVLRSDGTCAEHLRAEQLARLAAEGVPIRGERVDLAAARWDGR
ncbi:MAG TPA: MGMT family protein [Jatrophihabitans sp.]|nr:MGMT family protein [Jatrophihabitans sp.]